MSVICRLFFLSSYSYEDCVSSEMFGPWECQALIASIHQTWHSLSLGRFSSKAPAVFTGELQVVDYISAASLPGWSYMLALQKCRYCTLLAEGPWHIEALVWDPVLNPAQWVLHQPSPAPGALDAPLSPECQALRNLADCCLHHWSNWLLQNSLHCESAAVPFVWCGSGLHHGDFQREMRGIPGKPG